MNDNHNASDPAGTYRWSVYYDKVGLGPPRPTVLRALEALAAEGCRHGHAVDLGCGIGRDALPLLGRGWRVTGIDAEAAALDRLAAEAGARGLPAPALVHQPFEQATLPACELVNASFSLFFCAPAAFPPLWRRIRAALRPGGGRFAGHLLGPEDSWSTRPSITAHDPAALAGLLSGYAVDWLERETVDSVTPQGEAKRWDIWHLVLRRP